MTIATANKKKSAKLPVQSFWDKQWQNIWPPIMGILGFLLIWQVLSGLGLLKLPAPTDIVMNPKTRAYLLYPFFDFGGLNKGLALQTWASFLRVATGYIIAAVVGISTGILVGTSPLIGKALDPLFQFLRTVPPLAWVPIALAALQQNEPAALFVIFITAVWPILINTAVGVQQIPQDYRNVAKVLQISPKKYFFKILIPSALPYIFTGLRISIGLAWLAIIAAEIIMSGIVGIGFFIWNAYTNGDVGEVIIALVYIGAVGLLLDKFMAWLQTRILPEEQR
ncbi:MAG: nitrate ABC transporter permease [Pseudanabaena sp. RU_4_16]|nr:nitrate ABC transporter permease [Pseudanabaena sp. RU_4_16]NKB17310.1 nitrate ABC transporter permease [Pseudanabaena sp. CRU_2_10]